MEKSKQCIDTLVQLRKELHKHPEVSGKEIQTAQRIISFLEKHTPDELITGIGTTGVVAIYNGKKAGKTAATTPLIALRGIVIHGFVRSHS